MDGAEYEQRMNGIIEELLADAHAGMNMWGAGATKFTGTVNRFLDENNISRKPGQENGVRQTNGPPAERFSAQEPKGLSLPALDDESESGYVGHSLVDDPQIYTYDFLTAQPNMKPVELPGVAAVRDIGGKIDTAKVVEDGMKNALSVGTERDGRVYVKNRYTNRELWVTTAAIRHGLNGTANRMLTNARLGAVIGDVVQNAIPINALHNTADGVEGTYAMAGYAYDDKGREFVAIVTVEQRTNAVADISTYDMTHAISGRQKRSKQEDVKSQGVNPSVLASEGGNQADTKSQGFNLIKASSEISIADMLTAVKEVYQSILSEDVLAHLGETRNPKGHYTGRVRFSYAGENAETADLDARYSSNDSIYPDLDDETRAEMLSQKEIRVPAYDSKNPVNGAQIIKLKGKYTSEANEILRTLAKKCGVVNDSYFNADANLEFKYSMRSVRESINKQAARGGGAESFGKMLTLLPQLCENAVEIEAHTDKYVNTKRMDPNLKEVHVLLSAFLDGESLIPVQLEIKEYRPETRMEHKLYATVTVKNEAGISSRVNAASWASTGTHNTPASVITVPDLIADVKDDTGDLVKYLPDAMLNSEQLQAKERALQKEQTKLADMRYEYAVENGDDDTAEQMLRERASNQGYTANDDWRMRHRAPNARDGVSVSITDADVLAVYFVV